MSDFTRTPNLGLYKPVTDADPDMWGEHLNANADILDALVGGGGGGGGGASIVVSDVAPTARSGALWFDSVGLQLYIGYNDGTSTQWVTANNQGLGGDFMFGITKTDRSGAITLGNQAQVLMVANTNRRGWSLQNKSTANLWFNDLGGSADPAANSSTYLPPGAYYESESNGASVTSVSLIGDATGAQYVCKEW